MTDDVVILVDEYRSAISSPAGSGGRAASGISIVIVSPAANHDKRGVADGGAP